MKKIIITLVLFTSIFFCSLNTNLTLNAAVGDFLPIESGYKSSFDGGVSTYIDGTTKVMTVNGVAAYSLSSTVYFQSYSNTNFVPGAKYKVVLEYLSGSYQHVAGPLPELVINYTSAAKNIYGSIVDAESLQPHDVTLYVETLEASTVLNIGFSYAGAFEGEFINLQYNISVQEVDNVKYSISFRNVDSQPINSFLVNPGDQIGDLPKPTKTGMYFKNWFYYGTSSIRINPTDVATGNVRAMSAWSSTPVLPDNVIFTWKDGSAFDSFILLNESLYITNSGTQYYDLSQVTDDETNANVLNVQSTNPNYHTLVIGNTTSSIPPNRHEIPNDGIGIDLYAFAAFGNSYVSIDGTLYTYSGSAPIDLYISLEYDDLIENSYIVSFNSNGGSYVNSITVQENQTLLLPDQPIRNGYIFNGWYLDSLLVNRYEPYMEISQNQILHAKWTVINDQNNEIPDEPVENETSDVLEFLENYWMVVLVFLLGIAALTGKRR